MFGFMLPLNFRASEICVLVSQNDKNMLEKIMTEQMTQYFHLGLDRDGIGDVIDDVKVYNEQYLVQTSA